MSENSVATPTRGRIPTYIAGLGVVLGLGLLVESLIVVLGPVTDAVFPARLLTSAPFVGGLIYGGYWLARSDLPAERYPRVGYWIGGCLSGFVLVNAVIMIAVPPANGLVFFGWVRWAMTLGAAIGVAIGSVEARAIQREVVAERAHVRFEQDRTERELLSYLRELYTDEITPLVTDLADERASYDGPRPVGEPGDGDEPASTRVELLEILTRHVQLLLTDGELEGTLVPINLDATLRTAVADITSDRPAADLTIATDANTERYVLADRVLTQVFSQLFGLLIARADQSAPQFSVTVDPAGERVVVRIDDGAAIPDQQAVFDPHVDVPSEQRSGFVIVGLIIEYYGGTVEVVETETGGSAVEITLQRAAAAAAGESSDFQQAPEMT